MKNKFPIETKYISENMGEITIINDGYSTSFFANYNLKKTQVALIQLYEFNKNKDFFLNLINQYSEIHKKTKHYIINNYSSNQIIKDYFKHHFDILKEEILIKLFNIKTFEDFDINKIIEKIENPRLYFEGGLEGLPSFSVQYWASCEYSDIVLHIFINEKLEITECFTE